VVVGRRTEGLGFEDAIPQCRTRAERKRFRESTRTKQKRRRRKKKEGRSKKKKKTFIREGERGGGSEEWIVKVRRWEYIATLGMAYNSNRKE
jgi:hypothetical protein